MVLVAVRHALSIFNVLKKSRPDCSLTSEGLKQAKSLRGSFAHVVCSPMRRTQQTLDLSGINYSSLEYNDLARERRDDICDFMLSEPQVRETHFGFADRMYRLDRMLASLEVTHPEVLLVSHAYVILALSRIRENKELPVNEAAYIEISSKYNENWIPNAQFIELPSFCDLTSADHHACTGNCDSSQSESSVMPPLHTSISTSPFLSKSFVSQGNHK